MIVTSFYVKNIVEHRFSWNMTSEHSTLKYFLTRSSPLFYSLLDILRWISCVAKNVQGINNTSNQTRLAYIETLRMKEAYNSLDPATLWLQNKHSLL